MPHIIVLSFFLPMCFSVYSAAPLKVQNVTVNQVSREPRNIFIFAAVKAEMYCQILYPHLATVFFSVDQTDASNGPAPS